MGITRLKRKARRNKQRSADRVNKIKQLTSTPVIANVERSVVQSSVGNENKFGLIVQFFEHSETLMNAKGGAWLRRVVGWNFEQA